jgi:predicted Zn finger-like uncharacterized protein
MPFTTKCSSCRALFRLPEEKEGKKLRCPKCGETFTAIPAETKLDAKETRVQAAPAAAKKTAAPVRKDSDEDEERPPKKSRAAVDADTPPPKKRRAEVEEEDDEEEERPRKKKKAVVGEDEKLRKKKREEPDDDEEEDDEDEEPRGKKKKRKAQEANVPLVIGVFAAVILLMGGTSAAIVVWSIKNPRERVFVERERPANRGRVFAPQAPMVAPDDLGMGGEAIPVGAKSVAIALGADGTYNNAGALKKGDPLFQGKLYKLYSIPLEQGKTYQIGLNSGQFDTFLILLGPDNKTVAVNDDGGDGTNAMIVYQAAAAGTYRIVATSLDEEDQGNFTLTVRRQ